MNEGGVWLALGGCLSLTAALAHLATIFGGAKWYRTMGAGERLARAAERGEAFPAMVTLAIALVLVGWAAYGASGAGLIARLPLLRLVLIGITLVYLARGMVVFWPGLLRRSDLTPAFLTWSSLIVLTIGVIHAIGVWRVWPMLAAQADG